MGKLSANGMIMHYQTAGEGDDVVLVHGLTASLAFWYNTSIFPVLSKEFRITAYDLRGHGYSDMTPKGYTTAELADDLAALLRERGIQRACVVGHSYGGSIALHFALRHPELVNGVVLCDTGFAALRHLRKVSDWPGWETWRDELPQLGITPDWFSQADQQGVDVVLRKSYEIPQQFGLRRGARRDTPRMKKLLDETSVGTDFRDPAGLTEEAFSSIAAPVLAVYGESSPFCKVAEHLEVSLPCCRGEVLPKVGHFFLLHAVDLFLERAVPFLRDPSRYVRLRRGTALTGG